MHSSSYLVDALCSNNSTSAEIRNISIAITDHKQSCPKDGTCHFCWYLTTIETKDAEFLLELVDYIETFHTRFDGDIYTDPRAVHFSLLCNATHNICKFIRTTLRMVDETQVKCVWGCTRKENLTRGSGVGPGIIGISYFHDGEVRFACTKFADSYFIPGIANPCRDLLLDGVRKKTLWGVANPCVLVVFARSHPNKIYVYNAEFT